MMQPYLEVQQQLGMASLEQLQWDPRMVKRGFDVTNTGAPISVPVGEKTLGRIMNVLGDPVDEAGPINASKTMPIHRKPPSYEEQAGGNELLETGIKVPDLYALC